MAQIKESKRPIIEPDFAKRFESACDNNDQVPSYNRGRLTWIAEKLKEHYGIIVSRESVRKWMAGESRPKADKMRVLADLLKVSEGWLAFGSQREPSPEAARRRSVVADSSVNLVAGMFGMSGAHYAFPEEGDADAGSVHFYAIIRGRQHPVHVSVGRKTRDSIHFSVTTNYESLLIIGVVQRSPVNFDLYQIPAPMLAKFGEKFGDHVGIKAKDSDDGLRLNKTQLLKIEEFESLRRNVAA